MDFLKRYGILLAISGFLISCVHGQGENQYLISASDPSISVMGRTLVNTNGEIEFDWPGVSIEANFEGSSIGILMDDSQKNFYNVFIDDVQTGIVAVYSDTLLMLADNLGKGSHSLKLTKRTEGNQGMACFKGLVLEQGAKLLPPKERRALKIEFIGNSITCGYGTDCTDKTAPFTPETENNYHSFAPIIARAFDADYHIIAHSGQGVVRNYGHSERTSNYTMPDRYMQVFDTRKEPFWDFDSWTPDLVVINLGTNDFSTEPHPLETIFNREYTNLIKFIRSQYENVPIFCIVGPMTDEPCYSYVKKMVEGNRNYLNDKQVYFVGIPTYLMIADEDLGASWHPNYSGQVKMAEHIIPVISSVTGWAYGEIR